MGLSRTLSEINGDFSQKSQFFHPVYFVPPLTGFPLELDIVAGSQKTRMMELPGQPRFETEGHDMVTRDPI